MNSPKAFLFPSEINRLAENLPAQWCLREQDHSETPELSRPINNPARWAAFEARPLRPHPRPSRSSWQVDIVDVPHGLANPVEPAIGGDGEALLERSKW